VQSNVPTMTRNKQLAAGLNAALSILGIVLSLIPILRYGDDIPSSQPPFAILLIGIALGVLGLVGSYGIYKLARWGVILTVAVRAVDGLTALPGIFLADDNWILLWAIVSVVGAIIVIFLLLDRRHDAPAV
jgi:hypothetical protein